MFSWEPVVSHGTSFLPIVLVVLYLIGVVLSWVNYGDYFRRNVGLYGQDLVGAYLGFCVIGTIAFFFLSSTLWVRAARYVNKASHRARFTVLGIWIIFCFKDLPLFVIEIVAIMNYGWRNGYQGFCFIVQLCYFLLSFFTTWLSGIWALASFVETHWGFHKNQEVHDPRQTRQVESLGDNLMYPNPPPIMLQEAAYDGNADPSYPTHDRRHASIILRAYNPQGNYHRESIEYI